MLQLFNFKVKQYNINVSTLPVPWSFASGNRWSPLFLKCNLKTLASWSSEGMSAISTPSQITDPYSAAGTQANTYKYIKSSTRQQNARHFWRENYWKTIAPRLRWKKTLQIVSLNLHCMTWFVVAVIVKAALASNRNAPAVVFTFWRKNLIEKTKISYIFDNAPNFSWNQFHEIFREIDFTKKMNPCLEKIFFSDQTFSPKGQGAKCTKIHICQIILRNIQGVKIRLHFHFVLVKKKFECWR